MSDSQISRKTTNVSTGTNRRLHSGKVVQSGKVNPLNSYRSYTYNFTLAALRKEAVNNPELYRQSVLDFVILKSGGKGITGLNSNVSAVNRVTGQEQYEVEIEKDVPVYSAGELAGYTKEKSKEKRKRNVFSKDFSAKELVEGFNKKSPGRFDLFIDNIEIETIMSFTKAGGTTLPSGFKFRVFEPYSINGFIEALHVSAVAAGYVSYTQASFILKIDFIGYPDNDIDSFKGSQIIENSTRYFPIKFTGVDVEIGEKGTQYNCSAIPWNDSAFGRPNILKRPIAMAGNTVSEILQNFANNLNDQTKTDEQKSKIGNKDFDEYEIKFPVRTENGLDYNQINDIGKSTLQSIIRNNAIYKFPDPGRSQATQTPAQKDAAPEEIKLHPTAGTPPQIQFSENQQINEIIAAVIRDSEYVKNIIKENKIDDNGFVDYFLLKSDVINKDEIDSVSRKPFQKFVYSVLPYKIHFTRIPGYANQKFDPSKITALSLREYNYIYTGQNVDVLNFKLRFDKLFFEALPAAMGNNNQPGARDTGGQPNTTEKRLVGTDLENETTDQIGSPNQYQVPIDYNMDGANSSQPSNDPYYVLAKNIHSAIVDSKASMITGDIEIIGDPFYLVTGGIGNYNPKPGVIQGTTADYEADYLQREVLITINFRNPIDINPLEKGGMYYFETEKLPFSGVYRVTKVTSSFSEGIFKQRLEIIRYPGQIIGKTRETVVSEGFQETPKPGDQTVQATTKGINKGGVAASNISLLGLLSRGLPSPGLPGVLSNFIGQQGGLGGNNANLLTQFSGAVSRGLGNLTGGNAVFGSNNPINLDQLSSGIRLKTSGLLDLTDKSLSNASALVQSEKILNSGFSIPQGLENLSNSIVTKTKSLLNRISVAGSGIGEGATVAVNKVEDEGTIDYNSDMANINVDTTDIVPSVNLTLLGQQAKNLASTFIDGAKTLGAGSNRIISSVGDKITGLTNGTPKDPTAIAAKFGIDPAQLSGLSSEYQSKLTDQLESLSDKIPEDTNLRIAAARGLILEYVSEDKLKNIPATAPYRIAPTPLELDVSDTIRNEILSSPALKLPSVVDKIDIKNLSDKLSGASTLVQSVTSERTSIESSQQTVIEKVGNNVVTYSKNLNITVTEKFGSNTVSLSPLSKLIS